MAIEHAHLLKSTTSFDTDINSTTINDDDDNDIDDTTPWLQRTHTTPLKSKMPHLTRSVIIHTLLIFCYTFFAWLYIYTNASFFPFHSHAADYPAPGQTALLAIPSLDIQYASTPQELRSTSGYFGPPTPDMDAQWDSLLDRKRIRVTAAELARNGRTSVAMGGDGDTDDAGSGDSGYLAWLGVFHELHCLNFARMWKDRDYYYPNATEYEVKYISEHVDHCMDRLRAVLMCHPDVSDLITMYWDKSTKPMVNGTRILERCVDWDALMASTADRQISAEEMSVLKNPTL
ncbi:hypothetical protein EJ05DRAFT_170796 [Pseudovirgaria hyperparasitica]|uniref:Tat pathway signal sequence n=1 Tax=Pseudovirgaria hyperparasitica TaxID=470096 RepID=A0A6A6VWY3_9PEZI|nr:uncharacterized protein EJ05DRAFT_170796 [Pseudovirgaria hyperparasitica]KAF2753751.1 hypothetical protein EJ05DRAFT_170796 [Pseudovirgaria hyperparasitica]